MGIPLYVVCCFSLAAFSILSLSVFFFSILIIMCLGVILCGYILLGWDSWTYIIASFARLGKFLAIKSSYLFSAAFCLSSPGKIIMQISGCLMLPQISLKLSPFLKLFYLFIYIQHQWFPLLSSSSLIYFSAPFNLLWILSTVFFISFTIFFISDYSLYFLFVIPWTLACQAPLSMGFSRQEYWNGLPFPSPGALPDSGIKPGSPARDPGFLHCRQILYHLSHQGSPYIF